MKAGKSLGLIPAGTLALLDSLRVEKGFVHYGGEIAPSVTPLEAGLAFACKLKADQPDFIGKEALIAQKKEGWNKRLVSVKARPEDDISLWGHEQELLYRDGEVVGALSSGTYSHTLGCSIGLASVRGPPKVSTKWLNAGSYEVEVPVRTDGSVRLQRFPVDVSTRCLVDPDGERIWGSDAEEPAHAIMHEDADLTDLAPEPASACPSNLEHGSSREAHQVSMHQ